MKQNPARPWIRRGGFLFLLIAVLLSGWYLLRPNPLRAAAVEFANAIRHGDGDALLQATSPQERQCSGLDAAKLRSAWEILVGPRVGSSRFLRSEQAKQTSNELQATAAIWFADRDGNPWSIVAIANQADWGPATTILYPMLSIASRFDSEGKALKGITTESALAGIRRYRPQLEAIGIQRILLSPRRCMTWDELEGMLVRSIELERQQQTTQR